jgi:hypothetical protein
MLTHAVAIATVPELPYSVSCSMLTHAVAIATGHIPWCPSWLDTVKLSFLTALAVAC